MVISSKPAYGSKPGFRMRGSISGQLRPRGAQRARNPIGVGNPAADRGIDLFFDVVFNPTNRPRTVIYQHVRSPVISVKRLADTPCVEDRKSCDRAHKWLWHVAIDGDRLHDLGV